MKFLSLTARISLLFACCEVVVLLSLGWIVIRAVVKLWNWIAKRSRENFPWCATCSQGSAVQMNWTPHPNSSITRWSATTACRSP